MSIGVIVPLLNASVVLALGLPCASVAIAWMPSNVHPALTVYEPDAVYLPAPPIDVLVTVPPCWACAGALATHRQSTAASISTMPFWDCIAFSSLNQGVGRDVSYTWTESKVQEGGEVGLTWTAFLAFRIRESSPIDRKYI
jgi:hypothetical protein